MRNCWERFIKTDTVLATCGVEGPYRLQLKILTGDQTTVIEVPNFPRLWAVKLPKPLNRLQCRASPTIYSVI